MKTIIKHHIATTTAESTSVANLEGRLTHRSFAVRYKSSPETEYVYRFANDSVYLNLVALMSNIPSVGAFVAELKRTADTVWRVAPGESVGTLIQVGQQKFAG